MENELNELKEALENIDDSVCQASKNKYGIDKELMNAIALDNLEAGKEFQKDIDDYLSQRFSLYNFNPSEENLVNHYYNFLIDHPNQSVVISNVNHPTEDASMELTFKIIEKFKQENINFSRKYNTLKVINE
jgi:hypothetical protein